MGSFQRVQVRTASVGSGDIKRMVDIELVVVGVRPDSDLAAAAVGTMQKHKIIVLPVVDEHGAIVGVVHLHDLMRAGAV